MSNRRHAKKSDIANQLPNWSKRSVLSWSLFALAGVIAVQHVLAHGGLRLIPISMGWQDLLLGYPTAILLAVAGGIALDPNPRI